MDISSIIFTIGKSSKLCRHRRSDLFCSRFCVRVPLVPKKPQKGCVCLCVYGGVGEDKFNRCSHKQEADQNKYKVS